MKRILVPCDFSEQALDAFKFALDIAQQAKGSIHLIHVIELPMLADSVLMPTLSFEKELLAEYENTTKKEFANIIKKHNKEAIPITTKIAFGIISSTIENYITDNAIDLVVMGSHGTNGMKEFFIGSNTEKIVRRSAAPVIVIKDYYKGVVKNIVFPNTLELENQEDLVLKVKALQHFFGATLHIVWINTPLNFTTDAIAYARLNAFVKRFMFKDYTINVYNHTNAEDGIIEFTNSIKGNLIALGTHGRTGIAHLVSESLTESIVNHTKKLVWSYVIKGENVKVHA